jgi:hypothetical protein
MTDRGSLSSACVNQALIRNRLASLSSRTSADTFVIPVEVASPMAPGRLALESGLLGW